MKRLNKVHVSEIELNNLLNTDDVSNNYIVTTYTYEGVFIQNMYKLKDYSEKTALYVPFESFWPTYSSMSEKQKKYYFYWRNQYRLGNFIETDAAYIYVLVYELIEGIGWQKEIDGFYRLKDVWKNFRNCSDGLASDLELWIFDFVINHKLEREVSTDLYDIIIHSKTDLLSNIYLEHIQNDVEAQITWDIIKKFFLYDCSKDILFRGEKNEHYQNIITNIINKINKYYYMCHQKSMFDSFGNNTRRKEKHFIYANAVKSKNQYCCLEYNLYTENLELKCFLTNILKHSINIIRKTYGYKGRLHVEVIEKEYIDIIRECVDNQKKLKNIIKITPIVVDEDELNQMRTEAQEIVDMLIIEEEQSESKEKAEQIYLKYEDDLPEYEITQMDEEPGAFLNVLNKYQLNIIQVLLQKTGVEKELKRLEKENSIMIDSSIDEINELFYNYYNDILIDLQNGIPSICEQYEDILLDKLKNGEM
ncbi:MAG: TerB N-terminal domain-containing protein [Lachnospiraceae bacterium]|nr:TerB N-terminal domain-containing protein [Lachnospiraceae bacterium]